MTRAGARGVRRGEVWEYTPPGESGHHRVVVVSSDVHNDTPGAWPLGVLVARRAPVSGEIPTFAVALADPDPLGGVVVTTTLRELDPSGFVSCLGMMTGATMARITAALDDLLDTG